MSEANKPFSTAIPGVNPHLGRETEPAMIKVVHRERLRKIMEEKGEPAMQREHLVKEILTTFQNPEAWPFTDMDRIKVLRDWYNIARTIQETENLIRKCEYA